MRQLQRVAFRACPDRILRVSAKGNVHENKISDGFNTSVTMPRSPGEVERLQFLEWCPPVHLRLQPPIVPVVVVKVLLIENIGATKRTCIPLENFSVTRQAKGLYAVKNKALQKM